MRWAVVVLVLVAACGDEEIAVDAYPGTVRLGALVFVDGAGAIDTTDLVRPRFGTFLFSIDRSFEELLFAGYLDIPELGDATPIRRATPTDPRLPDPVHLVSIDPEPSPSWTPPALPALTVPLPCETRIAENTRAIANCTERSCAASVRQAGCDVVVDLSECLLGQTTGRVGVDATISFEAGSELSCLESAPSALELFALTCRTFGSICRLSIHPDRSPQSLRQRTIRIAEPIGAPLGDRRFTERLGSITAIGADIAVLVHPEEQVERCVGAVPSEIQFFDGDGQRTRTATVPACTWAIRAEGDTLFALEGGAAPSAMRIDATGRIDDKRRVDVPAGMVPTGVDVRLGLLAATWAGAEEPYVESLLTVLDAASLETRRRFQDDSKLYGDVAIVDATTIAVLDRDDSQVSTFDMTTGVRTQSARLSLYAQSLQRILFIDRHGTLIMSAAGRANPGFYVADPTNIGDSVRHTRMLEPSSGAYGLSAWPADPSQVLGTWTAHDEPHRTYAGLIDLTTGLAVPGAIEVGTGPAHRTAVDTLDRVWMTLAWTGELVIVDGR